MKELALTIGGQQIQVPGGIPTGGLAKGGEILTAFINLLFIVAVVLALVYLLLGGIRWVLSGGDPKGIEAARKQIMYAIIGLVVVLLAFFIVNLIGGLFGIKLVK